MEQLGRWIKDTTVGHKGKAAGMRTRDFLDKCQEAGLTWKESGPSYVVYDSSHSIRISKSTHELNPSVVRQYITNLGLGGVSVGEFQAGLSHEQVEVRRFRRVLRRLADA